MAKNKKGQTPIRPPENDSESPGSTQKAKGIIFEDILPSFEMYDFIFNRSILDNELPPTYDNENHLLSQPGIQSLDNSASNPDVSIINNIDDAQCLDLPIKISIVLTKDPPRTDQPLTAESKFKVFKPGDAVTGYIMIENLSDEPIQFGIFLLSLEGNVTTKSFFSDSEKTKLFRKKFLKMYDLCACYHRPPIRLGPTGDRDGEICAETGAVYSFMDENVLVPGRKYQKDFVFQLPETLLDTVCEHQSPEHLLTPSSFGVENDCFNGKGKEIQINSSLGYGTLSEVPGSPIKIRDLSSPGQSVSYSINAKMVGVNLESYKKFCSGEIKFKHNFAVLQQQQNFFNVSTAGVASGDSDWFFKYNISTDDQISQLQNACDDTIDELRFKNDLIQAGITETDEQNRIYTDNSNTKKINQLRDSYNHSEKRKLKTTDLGFIENITSATLVKSLFSKREGHLCIDICSSDKNSIGSFFIPKLNNVFASDDNEFPGVSSMVSNSKIKTPLSPMDSLFDSYFSRKLSTPTTSYKATRQFSPSNNQSASDKITISLSFIPKHDSPPPDSISIDPSLGIFTLQSESEIPIRIDNQFLLESSAMETAYWKITRIKNQMSDNLDKLHDLMKTNLLTVPKALHSDITAMTTITLFTPYISIFEKVEKTGLVWSKDMKGVYHTSFEIELVIDEKKVERCGISVIPGFQTCLLSRLYAVKLEFGCSKGNFKEHTVFATMPINVV